MGRSPIGSWQRKQLISDLQEGMGIYSDEDLGYGNFVNVLNRVVPKLHELAGWKNDEEYLSRIDIPIVKTVQSDKATGSSYSNTDQVLTVPLTGDVTWENDSDGFDDSWLDARGVITDADAITPEDYKVKIIGIVSPTQVVVESTDAKVIPAIVAADLIVDLSTRLTAERVEPSFVDLTTLENYKQIDEIEKITSSALTRAKITRVKAKDFDGKKANLNYQDQILWFREGDFLRFYTGSNLSTRGQLTMHLRWNPIPMNTDDDYIDVKDTNVEQVLRAAKVILYGMIPAELIKTRIDPADVSWWSELQAQKQAKAEEVAKAQK